jgi:hypothetical protein
MLRIDLLRIDLLRIDPSADGTGNHQPELKPDFERY